MDNWALEQTTEAWLIRGADGRVVCHVQYERDARTILDAVKAFQSTNPNTEGETANA